jgi:hypothetical protein
MVIIVIILLSTFLYRSQIQYKCSVVETKLGRMYPDLEYLLEYDCLHFVGAYFFIARRHSLEIIVLCNNAICLV